MLIVSDLHTYYGDSYVLQGVSLQANRGEVTVLMGRNGAGKTTLIRSIMGLTPPRRGSIRFEDHELAGEPTHRIARLGLALVPQGRRIFASLTVREHLTTAGRRGGDGGRWPLARIYELFPRLRERAGQRAATLSGGEQSMLAVARALSTDPACLLLDEPTEGLAPTFVQDVIEVLGDLKQTGELAILLVVHELPIAVSIADRIFVMSQGSIVYEGTPEELSADTEVQERHIGIGL